jgi:hypothetical protein
MSMIRVTLAATALAVTACVPQDPQGVQESFQIGDPQCDPDACGNGNSPVIAGVRFWRLHPDGLPNDRGLAIKSVVSAGGVPLRLTAISDHLVGYDLAQYKQGHKLIRTEGPTINGTRITVSYQGAEYRIRIVYDRSYDTPFWVVDPSKTVERYDFYYWLPWQPDSDPGTPLCKPPLDEDPASPRIKALVFTGEHYDPITKLLTTRDTDGWINIACEGGAPYKMHLIGHTAAAGARLALDTSPDERQAMLNAWTMNACGTGKAFTIQDTLITLQDRRLLVTAPTGYVP